jgi:hypothetical protein
VSVTEIEEESFVKFPFPNFFPEIKMWIDLFCHWKVFLKGLTSKLSSSSCQPASQPSPAQQSHGGGGDEDEEKIVVTVTVTVCRQLFSPTSQFCPSDTTILTPKIPSMTKPTHPPPPCSLPPDNNIGIKSF